MSEKNGRTKLAELTCWLVEGFDPVLPALPIVAKYPLILIQKHQRFFLCQSLIHSLSQPINNKHNPNHDPNSIQSQQMRQSESRTLKLSSIASNGNKIDINIELKQERGRKNMDMKVHHIEPPIVVQYQSIIEPR